MTRGAGAEAAHLASVGVPGVLGLLTVDRDALLTTPYHQAANRARELARGQDRHGSCGMGIGETVRYALDHPADAPGLAGPVRGGAGRARRAAVVRADRGRQAYGGEPWIGTS